MQREKGREPASDATSNSKRAGLGRRSLTHARAAPQPSAPGAKQDPPRASQQTSPT